ncbi:TonB-dependent siderophore receptor [Massilia genomosp. 1]|uniref:TonB-dependent siderophore receptor n=1 Tax=Massilia genomosp. 1 TaxID=2609280 RepID=A0ABX0N375_9BURK|nr:TonB-dependent siderophore receptor [Massilia genomosp. 1]NHZ64554.1 TonB-dependent siderophore receptor [Massilia genomosp. 1]
MSTSTSSRSLRASALAVQLVCGALLSAGPALHAQAQVQERQYTIAAGPLADALNRYAQLAGAAIVLDAEKVRGLRSEGLAGSHGVEQGFAILLRGTGYALGKSAAGYVLVPAPAASAPPPAPAGAAQTMDEIKVSARATPGPTTEGSNSYTSNRVTLGKGELALKDMPQSVSVLTREQMDDQGLTDLMDAANSVTGVVGVKGVGQGMVINARGFQIDSWQYDGVPIPRNTYVLGNWGTEGLAYFDRIEVLRGAAGLLQGTGSPGGAVNLVRKRGQAERTVALSAKAGSWNHAGAQLDAGGPLNEAGTLRARVVADLDRADSFIDYVWERNRALYAALDYDISADTTLGLAVSQTDKRSRPMVRGLPRYPDGTDIGLARSTFVGAGWNRAEIGQTTVYADLSHRFNANWRVKAAAVHMDESNSSVHQRMHGAVATDGSGLTYADWATDFNSAKLGADVYLNGAFDAAGMRHDVMLGANYSKYTSNDRYARTFNPGGNIFKIDHDRAWVDFDILQARNNGGTYASYDVRQKGVYGSWRARVGEALTVIGGVRVSWYDELYAVRRDNERNTVTASGKVTPYAGLVYALDKQWSAYASYTDVFETQSARSVSGQMLEPIIGSNVELGVKGELMDGRVNTSLAVFRYDHKNRAVADYAAGFACDGWYCSKASGKVRSQGVEAEASGEVLPGLQLAAGYTWNPTKLLEDADNKGKIFSQWTPKHMLRAWSRYQLAGDWNKLSVGAGFSAQSNSIGYERTFKVPGYTVWNARLAYQLNPQLALALNVNNLFDKRYYIPAFNQADGNNDYGSPRSVMFSIKYTPAL